MTALQRVAAAVAFVLFALTVSAQADRPILTPLDYNCELEACQYTYLEAYSVDDGSGTPSNLIVTTADVSCNGEFFFFGETANVSDCFASSYNDGICFERQAVMFFPLGSVCFVLCGAMDCDATYSASTDTQVAYTVGDQGPLLSPLQNCDDGNTAPFDGCSRFGTTEGGGGGGGGGTTSSSTSSPTSSTRRSTSSPTPTPTSSPTTPTTSSTTTPALLDICADENAECPTFVQSAWDSEGIRYVAFPGNLSCAEGGPFVIGEGPTPLHCIDMVSYANPCGAVALVGLIHEFGMLCSAVCADMGCSSDFNPTQADRLLIYTVGDGGAIFSGVQQCDDGNLNDADDCTSFGLLPPTTTMAGTTQGPTTVEPTTVEPVVCPDCSVLNRRTCPEGSEQCGGCLPSFVTGANLRFLGYEAAQLNNDACYSIDDLNYLEKLPAQAMGTYMQGGRTRNVVNYVDNLIYLDETVQASVFSVDISDLDPDSWDTEPTALILRMPVNNMILPSGAEHALAISSIDGSNWAPFMSYTDFVNSLPPELLSCTTEMPQMGDGTVSFICGALFEVLFVAFEEEWTQLVFNVSIETYQLGSFLPSITLANTAPTDIELIILTSPSDCEVGNWSPWSSCSQTCGGGTTQRTREITVSPTPIGGASCPALSEAMACNTRLCEDQADTVEGRLTLTFPETVADSVTSPNALLEVQSILDESGGWSDSKAFSKVRGLLPSSKGSNFTVTSNARRRRSTTVDLDLYFTILYLPSPKLKENVTFFVSTLDSNDAFLTALLDSTYFSSYTAVSAASVASSGCSCIVEVQDSIVWPTIPCNSTIATACATGHLGFRTRSCSKSTGYSVIDTSDCYSPRLEQLAEAVFTPETVENLTAITEVITRQFVSFGTEDVKNTIKVLEKTVQALDKTTPKAFDNFVKIASNVLGVRDFVFQQGEEDLSQTTSSASLPRVVEDFSRRLSEITSVGGSITYAAPNFVVSSFSTEQPTDIAWPGNLTIAPGRQNCSDANVCSSTGIFNETFFSGEMQVNLPAPMGVADKTSYSATFAVFGNGASFVSENVASSKQEGQGYIDSLVVSVTVDSEELNGDVMITFPHVNDEEADRSCAFWQFEEATLSSDVDGIDGEPGGQGSWSTKGCKVSQTDENQTTCTCNHLTNFAVLTNFQGTASTALELSIVTYVAIGICVFCLMTTFMLYACVAKLRNLPKKILMHLCINLSIALLIFGLGSDQTGDRDVCLAMGVLLHYFLLTAFTWMLVEGIHLYRTFVYVFNVNTRRLHIVYALAAYIPPLIVVIITAAILGKDGYAHEDACWLSVENGAIWAFTGPLALVVLFNLVVFVVIVHKVTRSLRAGSRDNDREYHIRALKASLSFFALLGLSWVFNYLALIDDTVAFQYIFAVAIMFQGILVFVFHFARDQHFRQYLSTRSSMRASNILSSKSRRVGVAKSDGFSSSDGNSSSQAGKTLSSNGNIYLDSSSSVKNLSGNRNGHVVQPPFASVHAPVFQETSLPIHKDATLSSTGTQSTMVIEDSTASDGTTARTVSFNVLPEHGSDTDDGNVGGNGVDTLPVEYISVQD